MVYNKFAPTVNPEVNGNPSSFAINKMNTNAARQSEMNRQYAGASTVPIVRTPYTSFSGPSQNLTSTQENNYKTNQQAQANSKFDHYAYTGGRRRRMKTKKSKSKRRRTIKRKTRKTMKCRK